MDYNVGDLVWIFIPIRKVGLSEKLMKRYFGPYRVTRKLSDVTFEVEPVDQPTRRRKTRDLVHVLRMKPYHDPEDQADLFKKRRVVIPETSQIIQKGSTAINLNEFDSSILETYEPVKILGRGGFGKVYLVKDRKSKEPFALKLIRKYEGFDEDFQIEKKVLELSIGFPFLIGLAATFETDERAYVLMDLVRGKDLYHYFKHMGRMPEDYARFYSAEAIIALNYLHTHRIIHRDVKLENILINNDGHIILADYGACREEGPNQNDRSDAGTKMYKAPEFLQDLEYNKAVDFWAIGAVIFELLVGFHPFLPKGTCENQDDYIEEAILHKPIEIPRYLSYRAYSILRAFLRRDPEQRLGSNSEFGYADIQLHPFYYNSFSFYELEHKMVEPPFIPLPFEI
ncbi:PRKCI [Cordylochernes scorpioides]|uniref:PRKCI n=1 Tax=Cordylochernes scorpioides TaxID=51811 RepID=A0ABY6KPZ2_9ARAC|nr:PRKCI [Cordylochernes scorpioides]